MRGEHDIYYKLIANLCQYFLRIFFKKNLAANFITDILYVTKMAKFADEATTAIARNYDDLGLATNLPI